MKSKSSTPKKLPRNSREVPATQAMLFELRGELVEKISKVHEEVKQVRTELKGEIQGVKTELKVEIHGLKVEIHGLKGEMHRVAVLVEEQNARNVVVLDAIIGLSDRQNRLESDHQELRKIVVGGKRV